MQSPVLYANADGKLSADVLNSVLSAALGNVKAETV